MKTRIEESIDLAVPVRTAYSRWTQFTEFPRFVPSIESVEQLDERHVRFHARLGARDQEWETEICEQIPDERIAWKSEASSGVVTFERVNDRHSRISFEAEYELDGLLADASSTLGVGRHRVLHALERFKDLVEELGRDTPGWRFPAPDEDDEDAGPSGD